MSLTPTGIEPMEREREREREAYPDVMALISSDVNGTHKHQ